MHFGNVSVYKNELLTIFDSRGWLKPNVIQQVG